MIVQFEGSSQKGSTVLLVSDDYLSDGALVCIQRNIIIPENAILMIELCKWNVLSFAFEK